MIAATDMLEWGRERARAAPWRGQASVAHLTPLAPGALSTRFLRHCLEVLSERGFVDIVTSALTPLEAEGFLEVGFEEQERLRLLAHNLRRVPSTPRARLRRGRSRDRADALAVDSAAFTSFWRLDPSGFDDAMTATPANRFRVAPGPGGQSAGITGYAISGRAGRQGYLQRLAVSPEERRRGVGLALTIDALTWMRRWGVTRAVVNTQLDNDAALSLYERAGFRPEPSDLAVLRYRLAR